MKQADFATKIGINPNTLRSYESARAIPNHDVLQKVCVNFSVNPEWLLMGTGPIFTTDKVAISRATAGNLRAGDPIAYYEAVQPEDRTAGKKSFISTTSHTGIETVATDTHELVLIPLAESVVSAGHGSLEVTDQHKQYAFRYDFLKRKGNINTMVLMRVAGDSMSPAIDNGDLVLIDQSQKQLASDKIFALAIEDLVYLKTINAIPGKIILSSFNPVYPPFEVDTREQLSDLVTIIGRAIWICREL
ncbi:MAG: helix-turn-helix domain-containing protein [Desulfovibrio sp.]|nr:helix-turn-helix domain-containing protein [Desulfovibrio sp.]